MPYYNYSNTVFPDSQLLFYANKLSTIAQISPVNPMIDSIIVHDFSVVFSSISSNEPTSQNPESFTWLNAVAPPLIAHTIAARYTGDNSATPGIAAMIPAAIVIATTAAPTDARISTAIRKATITNGNPLFSSAGPMISLIFNLTSFFIRAHICGS